VIDSDHPAPPDAIDQGADDEVSETFVLPGDRWHLEDERDFLQRSLDDARRELEAGDLASTDYDALVRRDEARLGAVVAALGVLDAEEAAVEEEEGHARVASRRRRRRWLAVVGGLALVAATVLLAVDLATPRAPGQPITGSIKVDTQKQIAEQLSQAATLVNEHSNSATAEALIIYAHVLVEEPRQVVALSETGWLEWLQGQQSGDRELQQEGTALVQRAVSVQANYYAAHLFLGTIDLEGSHDAAEAVAQYSMFLAENPPAALVKTAAVYLRLAYEEVGLPVPGAVPASAG
jgi:hypothetical protein